MSINVSLRCAAFMLFVLTPASPGQAPPATPPCTEWNLATDLRVSPDQENPNRDSCGNLGVWHFLESNPATFPAHIPSTYTLLPEFIPDAFFITGLEQWHGSYGSGDSKNQLPAVGINTSGSHQSVLGIEWPADVIRVHPLFDEFAIIGWRSPLTGAVAVTGGVADLHSGGPNGIGWSIDYFDGFTNTVVASGSILDGGAQEFQNGSGGASLASVTVNQGDFLYFLVDPQADFLDDSTELNVVITPTSGCDPPSNYCVGAINSTGHGASIGFQGSTSIAQNDLVLLVNGCPPGKPGLFFFGSYPAQVPFGEGFLCVTGNQQRLHPVVYADANGFASYPIDFTDPSSPVSLIQPGMELNFQLWYRDPQPIGQGFNFTDALSAHFCP